MDKWGYGLLARGYNEMMAPQHTMMSFKYLKALLLLSCGNCNIQIQTKCNT